MVVLTGGLISWLTDVTGIFLGNTLWLVGLMIVGVGIWGYKVKKDSVVKIVNMMSMMTGGQPKGLALRMKQLIDPVDRTDEFGRRMLITGIIIIVIGCTFILRCNA